MIDLSPLSFRAEKMTRPLTLPSFQASISLAQICAMKGGFEIAPSPLGSKKFSISVAADSCIF